MLFKLSSRNVSRSIRDYGIYFLTLALGVCIFYVFNSLESQTIMMDLSETKKQYVELISQIISMVSVLVSCILGFLIIYANNFIIKKRNKEFGIYMRLGISKNKISFMLFVETILIGILSLVAGIFIGVFLSQGLAGLTAKLFESDMREYKFIFSKDACVKTVLYFGIMFAIVMFFNFIVVSRYNLIDLINSSRKNEKLKNTNLIVSVLLFITSLICLGYAYKLILENSILDITNTKFKTSIALGVIGTLLFFRALAGFLIKVSQNSKNYYLKNLNTFTLRQLNSKINMHYISMSVICLMLFVAIGMSSTGIAMKKTLEDTVEFQAAFDMTMNVEVKEEKDNVNIEKYLMEFGIDLEKYYSEKIEYSSYYSNVNFKELLKDTQDPFLSEQIKVMRDFNVPIMKLSDYNKINNMKNKEEIHLKDSEVLLLTDISSMKEPIEEFISTKDTITIGDNNLNVASRYEFDSIETVPMGMNFVTLIVEDKYVQNFTVYKNYLSLNYKGNKLETEEEIISDIMKQMPNSKQDQDGVVKVGAITRLMCFENNMAMSNIFLFVGIYIGIVFLIASAAVLALSQLSGAIESVERYKVLKKIGVSDTMINKSILIQILLYFVLPIGLALVHSIYGIRVADDFIRMYGDYNTIDANIASICAILVVYGVYLIATYNGYKKIIENEQ